MGPIRVEPSGAVKEPLRSHERIPFTSCFHTHFCCAPIPIRPAPVADPVGLAVCKNVYQINFCFKKLTCLRHFILVTKDELGDVPEFSL